MRIIGISFIISILLHLLLFIEYKKNDEPKKDVQKEHIEKTEVKIVKLQEKKAEPKIETKKVEPTPPPKVETPVITKKTEIEKQTLPKTKDIKKAKEFQNKVLKEQVISNKPTIQEKTLEKFLSQKEPINKDILNELQELYGKEYDNFTKVQKAYLEKNINNFQIITQRVLNRMGYPKLAAKLKIGGINVVEFMFHPNGNISDLKIIGASGYTILDEYTLELIEIAYKDYPKPSEPTKLRFRVFYRMY
ncbi:energy transducer TonB [Aliarcobacter lanthieri]|uniref:energy transducer TonB n=1 Tax=Aliarcobacter lanthieri TaxID=1355374 RepID=UPI00047AB525|nr:energy transducer TonB [Aliarcobacter lanthieri]QKF59508.1 TonB domain-containing protein [Aliarcobacter lanthieri]